MIYFVRCQLTKLVKIGYTNREEIAWRLLSMQTGSPGELKIVGALAGGICEERVLHGKYADKHVRGEWFALTDADLDAEPFTSEGYIEAGRENDAWESARYRDCAIRNEKRGAGMAAEREMWDRSFLDALGPKERRDYVEAMLARWRALRRKIPVRKRDAPSRREPHRS